MARLFTADDALEAVLTAPTPPSGDTQSPYFTLADAIKGIGFPPGPRTVFFVGRHGTGTYCYGTGADCGAPDDFEGSHFDPYELRVWLYDANDLASEKAGQKTIASLRPYATPRLPGPAAVAGLGSVGLNGAGYDPVTHRLDVSERRNPVLHVWQVSAPGTTPPPALVERCGDGLDNDQDGHTDEGCNPSQPDLFQHVETITIPASTVTVPAQTITRTLICSRSKGTCGGK